MNINQALAEYELRRAATGDECAELLGKAVAYDDLEKRMRTILETAEKSEFKAVGLLRLREILGPVLGKAYA